MMHRRDLHPQFQIYQVSIDQVSLSNVASVFFLYSPWPSFSKPASLANLPHPFDQRE